MNEHTYFAFRGKGDEAVILYYDTKYKDWHMAVGNYSTNGTIEQIQGEISDELPQNVELLPSECYNDDLMIIRLDNDKYEFQSFALLVDEIGTVEEIVHKITNFYLWNSSEIFEGINVEEFKPNSMAAMFYAAFQKGGEQE